MKEKNAFLFNLYKFYPDKTVVTQWCPGGRGGGGRGTGLYLI